MATAAQVRADRKRALRNVRRMERTLDTEIEKMERLLFRLLDRKTILTTEDAVRIGKAMDALIIPMNRLQSSVADFYIVTTS